MTDRRGVPHEQRDDRADEGGGRTWLVHVYDVVSSAGSVFLVGLLIVAVSGVWPPLVAIESGSMEPHIQEGDLVFVMDEERFPGPDEHGNTGIVTAHDGAREGYETFSGPGDVIVYHPGGDESATPIIHRAMFWVDEGENWYGRADGRHLGTADDCDDLVHCEAPNAGFITKGDNNPVYDQVGTDERDVPVKPEWIVGTAEVRVPHAGWLRLGTQSRVTGGPASETRGSQIVTNGSVAGGAR